MKKLINLASASIAAALLCVAAVSPSYAATTAFVSGAGKDTNPCTMALPCRTIGQALGFVGTGGTVSCLDAGPYTESIATTDSFTLDRRGVIYTSAGGVNGFPRSLLRLSRSSRWSEFARTATTSLNLPVSTNLTIAASFSSLRPFIRFTIASASVKSRPG